MALFARPRRALYDDEVCQYCASIVPEGQPCTCEWAELERQANELEQQRRQIERQLNDQAKRKQEDVQVILWQAEIDMLQARIRARRGDVTP